MTPLRAALRRTVFLLAGGAVTVAFFILASSVYAPLQDDSSESAWLFLMVWLAMSAAAGLLPGVREIEVAGARDLLRVAPESLIVPEPTTWPHRWRTALWTLLHQVVGFVTGLALTVAVLAAGVLALYAAGRRELRIPQLTTWTLPHGATGAVLVIAGTVLTVTALTILMVLAGRGAAWSAPLLLGPTGPDRLRLAEERLAREHEHLRLSQDLHDGVGHSLSAISLQATAAERTIDHPDGPAAEALRTIRELAGDAVDELEHVLTVLREEADGSTRLERQHDLRDLPELVADHRGRGMDLEVTLDEVAARPPSVLGRIAHRVAAEGLANAAKHAPGAAVRLEVETGGDLVVTVRNPVPGGTRPTGLGHGLTGLREQAELVGGTLQAGPDESGAWVLRARLPRGGHRGR